MSKICLSCLSFTLTSLQYHDVLIKYVLEDECFCSKFGLEVALEHAKSNLKTPISQIWVICNLLPFVRVGQLNIPHEVHLNKTIGCLCQNGDVCST